MKLDILQAQYRAKEAEKARQAKLREEAEKARVFMDEFNSYLQEFDAKFPTLGDEWYEHLSSSVNPKLGMKNLALEIYVDARKRNKKTK